MGRKRSTPDPDQDGPPALKRITLGDEGPEFLDGRATPLPRGRLGPAPISPEPKLVVTLVLDISGSMVGAGALRTIVACLPQFKTSVLQHSLLARKLSWSLVGFAGTVQVISPYQPLAQWTPPAELAGGGGGTAMGSALLKSLALQEEQIQELAAQGIATQQVVMPFFSDGFPNSEPPERLEEAIRAIEEAEKTPTFSFWPIAVEGANFDVMKRLTRRRPPLGLAQVDFQKFFKWLSVDVLRVASISQPGERIGIASPIKGSDNADGWGFLGRD